MSGDPTGALEGLATTVIYRALDWTRGCAKVRKLQHVVSRDSGNRNLGYVPTIP